MRHRGLPVSWAPPFAALHLKSGAGRRFSTWNHSSRSETVAHLTPIHDLFEPLRGVAAEVHLDRKASESLSHEADGARITEIRLLSGRTRTPART